MQFLHLKFKHLIRMHGFLVKIVSRVSSLVFISKTKHDFKTLYRLNAH